MKKTNKNSCVITKLWPSVEDMKKDLFIDLDKQEVTRLSTGNKLTIYLAKKKDRKQNKCYYKMAFWKNNKTHQLLLHRLFFYWHHGYLPKILDHKDTNSQNNQIENLRELTDSENKRNTNKKKNCTSKYKGVSLDKHSKKWRVHIRINGKTIQIGTFNNEDDAGQAYNDAVRKYGLEDVSVLNDTPQERARTLSLFDNLEPITNLK